MDKQILTRISLIEDTLTRKERHVVRYIIDNGEKVMNMRIQELAKEINIGYSPIYSLIKKIGFAGYREFIIAFTAERLQNTNDASESQEELLEQYTGILGRNINSIQQHKVHSFVDMIVKAKNIYICAFGDTALAAQELASRLNKSGLAAFAIKNDADSIMSRASVINSNDLWIIYSMSGTTKIVISSAHVVKERGAKIITVTSKENSELIDISDDHQLIVASITYERSRILLSTLFPFLILNDQIIARLFSLDYKYIEASERISQLVAKYN